MPKGAAHCTPQLQSAEIADTPGEGERESRSGCECRLRLPCVSGTSVQAPSPFMPIPLPPTHPPCYCPLSAHMPEAIHRCRSDQPERTPGPSDPTRSSFANRRRSSTIPNSGDSVPLAPYAESQNAQNAELQNPRNPKSQTYRISRKLAQNTESGHDGRCETAVGVRGGQTAWQHRGTGPRDRAHRCPHQHWAQTLRSRRREIPEPRPRISSPNSHNSAECHAGTTAAQTAAPNIHSRHEPHTSSTSTKTRRPVPAR
jgi:hypothetical protein